MYNSNGRTLKDIIDLCVKHKIKLNLTTNGGFHAPHLRYTVDEWCDLLLPVLSDIKFSWNGATKATNEAIMKFSKWENQVQPYVSPCFVLLLIVI
jgi:hypothetical protein